MHWTGSQWSVGFEVSVTIGLVTAGATVLVSATDARLIRTVVGNEAYQLHAEWHVQAPATDYPTIVSCGVVDFTTGEIELAVFNQLAADTNFNVRGLYVELSPPYQP